MRGFAIAEPEVGADVVGLIRPGSKVDVLLSVGQPRPHHRSGGDTAATVVQKVEVLSAERRLEPAGGAGFGGKGLDAGE
jgi:Flp pilus assembly protein CpaB